MRKLHIAPFHVRNELGQADEYYSCYKLPTFEDFTQLQYAKCHDHRRLSFRLHVVNSGSLSFRIPEPRISGSGPKSLKTVATINICTPNLHITPKTLSLPQSIQSCSLRKN